MKSWLFLIFLGLCIGLLIGGAVFLVTTQPHGESIQLEPPPTPSPIKVQVLGSVLQPGLYQLPLGSRLEAAIQAAGGVERGADLEAINPAQLLRDGDRVVIPSKGQYILESSSNPPSIQTPSLAGTDIPAKIVNINTATLAELEGLPSIGPSKAEGILKYRAEHGVFTSIEQLLDVPGIGPVLLNQIKDLITLGEIG